MGRIGEDVLRTVDGPPRDRGSCRMPHLQEIGRFPACFKSNQCESNRNDGADGAQRGEDGASLRIRSVRASPIGHAD